MEWDRTDYAAADAAAGDRLEELLLCGFDPIGDRGAAVVSEFCQKLLSDDDSDEFPSGARLSAAARKRLGVLSSEPSSHEDWRGRAQFGELLTTRVFVGDDALPAAPVAPAPPTELEKAVAKTPTFEW